MRGATALVVSILALPACRQVEPAPAPEPADAPVAGGLSGVPAVLPPRDVRDLPPLSDAGLLAAKILLETERFTDDAIGEGCETPIEVDALRTLVREKEAAAALRVLAEKATTPGRLFALCGLWYVDPQAFGRAAAALREERGEDEVHTLMGCCGGTRTVAGLLKYDGEGAPVRLRDRRQTIREWREEAKAEDYFEDIVGGGYPAILLGRGGW